jgi:hypothetical protein
MVGGSCTLSASRGGCGCSFVTISLDPSNFEDFRGARGSGLFVGAGGGVSEGSGLLSPLRLGSVLVFDLDLSLDCRCKNLGNLDEAELFVWDEDGRRIDIASTLVRVWRSLTEVVVVPACLAPGLLYNRDKYVRVLIRMIRSLA